MKYNIQPMAYIAWALATLIGILIGYLAGYAKKKGENKAMHEDIEKVVDQMRAVTTVTKQSNPRFPEIYGTARSDGS